MSGISQSQQAMNSRRRVTFGPAYVRDVLAGVQRDFEKQLIHAASLGLGTVKQLRRLKREQLRTMLAEKLKELEKRGAEQPKSAEYKH
jgi:DNA-binding HxlR family transcriptional regulator